MKHQRVCGDCTACCEGWLGIDQPTVKASLNSPCSYCKPDGCAIYATRPIDPCQNFQCAWLARPDVLAQSMRPNKLKIILSFDRLRWKNFPVLVGVTAAMHVSPIAFSRVKELAYSLKINLLILEYESVKNSFNGKKRLHIQGEADFSIEMAERFRQGERLW